MHFTIPPPKWALPIVLLALLCVTGLRPAFAQDDGGDPALLFNEGQDAHEKGDLETAVSRYKKALEILPEFPEAEFQLGSAYLQMGKERDAEEAFRRALALRADWTLPMPALASLLTAKGEFGEAERLLKQAISADPGNFAAFSSLAELRLRSGATAEALQDLLKTIRELSAKSAAPAALWVARASLERSLGDLPAAAASIEKALRIEPRSRNALSERVEIALEAGDVARALAEASSLSKSFPSATSSSMLLARALSANGRNDEAIRLLESVTDPRADLKTLKEKLAAVAATSAVDLEKSLGSDPKNPVILGRLCSMLRTENPQKALVYCQRAAAADPQNLDHAVGFGAALVQTRRYADAVEVLRRVVQFAPDHFTTRANLATALFQLKRYEQAKPEYLWLAEKKPDLAITYYFLALTHDQLTEYLDAMANYQQFLRLADPAVNQLEIDKVNFRLPSLQKLIKEKKGRKS